MAFFKAKVDGKLYEISKLTLGDTQILKHKFGVTDLSLFSGSDPDVIVGLLALAVRKADPSKTIDQAAAEVAEFDFESFSPAEDDAEVDAAPLAEETAVAEAVAPDPVGAPETTLPTPGDPSTPST